MEKITDNITHEAKISKIKFNLFSRFISSNTIGERIYYLIKNRNFIAALILLSSIYFIYKVYMKYLFKYGFLTKAFNFIYQIRFLKNLIDLVVNFLRNSFNLLINN
jgi:hypothetical protein